MPDVTRCLDCHWWSRATKSCDYILEFRVSKASDENGNCLCFVKRGEARKNRFELRRRKTQNEQ